MQIASLNTSPKPRDSLDRALQSKIVILVLQRIQKHTQEFENSTTMKLLVTRIKGGETEC